MKAAVVDGAESIEVRELQNPALAANQVRVAVDVVGLCGSDLSYYRRGANGAFVIREPLVLGHEITGTVVEIGAEVPASREPGEQGSPPALVVGSRVVVHPMWPCPPQGETTVPAHLAAEPSSFLGSASTWPHTNGGLAEFLTVRPERLRVLPEGLPNRRAVLAEPLAVVLHALSQFRDSFEGLRVLVCGSGPIGLLAVVALKRRGVAAVSVTDLHQRPLDVALRVGASEAIRIDLGEAPATDAFDVVIEATGVPASLNASLAAVRAGGTIIQLGMLSRDGVTADLGTLVVKEVALLGTHRFAGELDDAISLLADAPECDSIVTDSVELARVSEAFRRAGDAVNSSKVLVTVAADSSVYTDQLFSG
jgi:L-idonate 5-dehydrogenase